MRVDQTKGTSRNVTRIQFESLRELAKYIDGKPRTWSRNLSAEQEGYHDWDLGLGFKGAVNMAREGWLEGAQRARKALKAFAPTYPEQATKTDVYGFRPHVPRYCAGAPDNMIRHNPRATDGMRKALTVYVNVNANADMNAEYMANYGLAVAQWVNTLQVQGTRVELWGCATTEGNRDRITHSWRIKPASQPIDLAVLSFCVGHPAMLRRLEFALCERAPVPEMAGYGRAVLTTMADQFNPPKASTILTGMLDVSSHSRTPESALEYVRKQLDKFLKA